MGDLRRMATGGHERATADGVLRDTGPCGNFAVDETRGQ